MELLRRGLKVWVYTKTVEGLTFRSGASCGPERVKSRPGDRRRETASGVGATHPLWKA